MSTLSETPEVRAPALATPIARAVAEDLEAIFPNAPPAGAGHRLRVRRDHAHIARAPQPSRLAAVGALVAAAFVGVAAGALLTLDRAPPSPLESAVSSPIPGPLAPAAPPVADPLLAAAPPLAPTPSALPAQIASGASPRVAGARKASVHKASVHKAAVHKATVHRISSRTASKRARPAPALSMQAADARLRRAYMTAIRVGVPRDVLVDYRDEWERLRHRDPRQSSQVARRYVAMAGELDRVAKRQGDRRPGAQYATLRP